MILSVHRFYLSADRFGGKSSSVSTKIRRKDIISDEIIHSASPGFIRIAPKVGASASDKFLTGYITDIDIHIQYEVGHFLHGSGDREVRAELTGKSGIAAATCL
jgi:hypothetical protein